MTGVILIAGLILLVLGAEMLVRGGASLAARLGISSLVIGLTIVAYGTSSPELVVSLKGTLAGQGDIALGNVIGSNIFNVLFILGISALICPLKVSQQLVRVDVPIMIGVSFLAWGLGLDGKYGMIDGLIFLAGIAAYTWLAVFLGKKEKKKEVLAEYDEAYGAKPKKTSWVIDALLIAGGLAVLIWGARWFVDGAVALARSLGVSELVIGLTIIAAGTSMPEVATSIMASLRKERDIAVGNVVGSNIYNILAILGVSALAAGPEGLKVAPAMLSFDIPVMVVVAGACLPIFFTGNLIARWEGFVFLFYYAVYTAYLILKSSSHDALPLLSQSLLWFILPLTALTAAVIYYREKKARHLSAGS